MSTTVMSDAMVMPATESQPVMTKLSMELEFAKCDCCGLTEECTLAYIERIRERYQGKWICGLCGEAVKDEIIRCERLISNEEALNRHMSFCEKFKTSSPPPNPAVHLISAMRRILRKSLDSPRGLRSTPCSPRKNSDDGVIGLAGSGLSRSESCFPALSLVVDSDAVDDLEKLVRNDEKEKVN